MKGPENLLLRNMRAFPYLYGRGRLLLHPIDCSGQQALEQTRRVQEASHFSGHEVCQVTEDDNPGTILCKQCDVEEAEIQLQWCWK